MPTIGRIGEGDQSPVATSVPTGSSCRSPSRSRNTAVTTSGPEPPVAKKRIVGWARSTHTGAVVADAPAGSASALDPGSNGSFAATTAAPSLSVQPVPPPSKPPSGAASYHEASSQGANVRSSGCGAQSARARAGATSRSASASSGPNRAGRVLGRHTTVMRDPLARPTQTRPNR